MDVNDAAVKLVLLGSIVTTPAPVKPLVVGATSFWNTKVPAAMSVAPV